MKTCFWNNKSILNGWRNGMSLEAIILIVAWLITIIVLIISVPKNKIREAMVIFLFKQVITWIIGLLVVELGLIVYPVRSFAYATRTSFDFEYMIYPAICVIFNLHFPLGKKGFRQFMHYVTYCSAITIIEIFIEKYTDIIEYINWEWYVSWITLFITFYISRIFYLWFFKKIKE
jgi:hypothetical protein